ncbi:PGN_0703 family putative restriction endonuclease [Massilia niabensis]|uniref:Restriction endonuclease n=1 Tax=Massilia niabensis TaxID=544910 RepID=A0ABW0L602_9BURK
MAFFRLPGTAEKRYTRASICTLPEEKTGSDMLQQSGKSIVLGRQREWAQGHAKSIDSRGYLDSIEANLLQPLSAVALAGFKRGSGSELADTALRPAKMKALHSSAALAVNVFDYWSMRDPAPLGTALGLARLGRQDPIRAMAFERQYPTGLGGNPPNLDIALHLESGFTIGVESKFTEWMTPKSTGEDVFRPAYFPEANPVWRSRCLPRCQQLAEAIQAGKERFQWLDAPQLLKHALGLATALPGQFSLQYLYFDSQGKEGAAHRDEIGRFSAMVADEIRFDSRTYQTLFGAMANNSCEQDRDYIAYLRDRYFLSR